MENLNPTWLVTNSIIYHMQSGMSVRRATLESVRGLNSHFEQVLFHWLTQTDSGQESAAINRAGHITPHQHTLLGLLSEGMLGRPILESLVQFEEDVRAGYMRELEEHIAKLPFLGMLPLLVFIGPAFLLLLIGPILTQLLQELAK